MTLTARPTPLPPMRSHGRATISPGRHPVEGFEPTDTIGTLHLFGGRGGYVGDTTLTTKSATALREELDALLSSTPAIEGGGTDAR